MGIKQYRLEDRQAHFVELWHRLTSDKDHRFSWTNLRKALRGIPESGASIDVPMGDHIPPASKTVCCGAFMNTPLNCVDWSLKKEVEDLKHHFECIQQAVMKQLDEKEVKFEQFKRAVSSYGPRVQLNSFSGFKKISGSGVEIMDVFSVWNTDVMWSFLDFYLLDRLVKDYGDIKMTNSMRQYSSKMEDFRRRTTVSKLMAIWDDPCLPEEYERCKKMIVNLNIKADNCTLEQLEHTRMKSCQKLLKGIPLSEAALVLFQLEAGCIRLTWIVWADVVEHIRVSLVQCIAEGEYFKENSIISLELDGEHFMPMERVSELLK
jgi:hypothetical protein